LTEESVKKKQESFSHLVRKAWDRHIWGGMVSKLTIKRGKVWLKKDAKKDVEQSLGKVVAHVFSH